MSAMLIDSGVETVRDLAGLLPAELRDRLEPDMLTDAPTAAALRVLATIRSPQWHDFVRPARIDWTGLLAWGRSSRSASIEARVEAAASLAGNLSARVDLLRLTEVLDRANLRAVVDGLRIAVEGLEP